MTQQVEIKQQGPSDLPATGTGAGNSTQIVIAVTASSVHVDLTAAAYEFLLQAIKRQAVLMMVADTGTVWYRWSHATASGVVDETMTAVGATPANQAAVLFGGTRVPNAECPPNNTQGLIIKGSTTTFLRMWLA